MKTQKQILDKIDEIEKKRMDWIGTERSDLTDFLDFKNAKKFLKEGTTEKEWKEDQEKNTKENIIKKIKGYMEFAWEKANDCRGISADRSINHMSAWIWLLGDEKLQIKFLETEYEHYGKEKLIVICEHLNIDYKKYDNEIRTNTDG